MRSNSLRLGPNDGLCGQYDSKYKDEYQHQQEFSHDGESAPEKPKAKAFAGRGRVAGSKAKANVTGVRNVNPRLLAAQAAEKRFAQLAGPSNKTISTSTTSKGGSSSSITSSSDTITKDINAKSKNSRVQSRADTISATNSLSDKSSSRKSQQETRQTTKGISKDLKVIDEIASTDSFVHSTSAVAGDAISSVSTAKDVKLKSTIEQPVARKPRLKKKRTSSYEVVPIGVHSPKRSRNAQEISMTDLSKSESHQSLVIDLTD